ncbi:hypothetical protein GCM10009592_14440 [Brachybacterium rhamnosum]
MPAGHGTRARYCRGCRCEECRAANSAYDRALRARAGLPDSKSTPSDDATLPRPHGRTAARIEDLEFLLSVGEHPDRAAERVGWTPKAAERALHRHGLHQLASRLRERVAS